MLLRSYKISKILPSLADPEKIRVIADIYDEIQEVLSYLNSALKECHFNHQALT